VRPFLAANGIRARYNPKKGVNLKVWYSDIYSGGIDPTARFPRERYRMVRRMLEAYRSDVLFLEPPSASEGELCLAHSPAYVRRFLDGALGAKEIRRIGLRPWTPGILPRMLQLVGGTLEATRHVLSNGGFAGNLAGGTHHAFRDLGSGYCVFNDIAVSARLAQSKGCGRILVLDLDVHQGDGTAAIFQDDPTVFTFSMHCGRNFPFQKQRSDWDISLDEGTGDAEFLAALEGALPALLSDRPGLVFLQGGVDGLSEDRLGRLALTRDGLRRRNALVLGALRDAAIPAVVTMGGGYAEPLIRSVEAHADLYMEAARLDSVWPVLSGSRVPSPSTPG
jgi:acetoin utilization deacetylase AcuC-like enzyme